jgi:hypothetical protein
MSIINNILNHKILLSSDINEHLVTIERYAKDCESAVELGVREMVSTWALISGLRKKCGKLLCVDIAYPSQNANPNLNDAIKYAKDECVNLEFILESSLNINILEIDLLFIDTLHYYDQLIQELNLHGNKVKKYIIMHDTEICGLNGHENKRGLLEAINEFLANNPHWKIIEQFKNNNGLTILGRTDNV